MNPWLMGENITCPNDPAAVPMPRTKDLFSGPTTRTMATIARVNAENAMPSPVSTPPVNWRARLESAWAIPQTPSAYITAPATMTLTVPCLSAMAPAKGSPMPHRRFCSAMAQSESFPAPVLIHGHGFQEQSKRGTDPETRHGDQAAGNEHGQGGPPVGGRLGHGSGTVTGGSTWPFVFQQTRPFPLSGPVLQRRTGKSGVRTTVRPAGLSQGPG